MYKVKSMYLKRSFLFSLFIGLTFYANAQWSTAGDNTTAGRIIISGSTSSVDYDDIAITRYKSQAGIRLFNENAAGRAIFLFGQTWGSKYGYLAYHGESYDAGLGHSLTFRPSSAVLSGSAINGLGIISVSDIRFNAGGEDDSKQRMVLKGNGMVGVGTMSPTARLHIQQGQDDGGEQLRIGRGSGAVRFVQENNKDNLYLYNSDASKLYMLWKENGNVGIGSTNPDAKLTVKGTIHAEEVKIDLNVPGPDYVFDASYNLPSLEELNAYIKINRHLPEVPSACAMEENGVNLGEMNMILLKKVEELTLYVIELKKEGDKQRVQNSKQQSEIELIKNKIYNPEEKN